jgi:signal transduction histidine kinase
MHHSTGEYGFCKRGIGLGLAIVRKFIEMHDGSIDFDTTPGKGSTFRFTLPLEPKSDSIPETAVAIPMAV